jgi:hypothetical protein
VFGQAYGAALAIVLMSVILGRAICGACGGRQPWATAPAVGFSALIILAGASIKLPGGATSAIVICGLAVAVSIAFMARRQIWPFELGDLVVGAVALVAGSLPFIASGRVGLPGVSMDNDTALHLLWAEGLRSPRMAQLWPVPIGYPLGPHSVVAMVGTALNMPLDMSLTGLLIAIVPVTAIAAAGLLAGHALWRRTLLGVVCSLAYLVAAFYGEGAFKETIMAGLLLAFVVYLSEVRPLWSDSSSTRRWLLTLPAGLLVICAIYTYSVYGVLWFGVTIVLWAAATLLRRPRAGLAWLSAQRLRDAAPWICMSAALGLLLLLPIAGQIQTFTSVIGISPAGSGAIARNNLGNLVAPLSPYEALGVWWNPDFRLVPINAFHAGQLAMFALAVVVFGLVWSIRRRELLIAAAAAGAAVIWWYSDRTQSPYVAAKALVIASPLFVALGLKAMLTTPDRQQRPTRALLVAAGLLYAGFAAYSSFDALRTEPVQAPETNRELAAFHRTTKNLPVLFLGVDDFAPWQLRESAVTTLSAPSDTAGSATTRPNKPFDNQALDFDSVDPIDLDHFRYVITTNTTYASQPPPNFRLIASARFYDLWERTGPTALREVLEPPGAPGAILDCRSVAGRRLSTERGEAAIMPTPVTVEGRVLSAGQSASLRLPLPRGSWDVSLQVVGTDELDFAAQGRRWSLPPYLGRPGPFFAVGVVRGLGVSSPVTLTVKAVRPSFLDSHWPSVGIGLIAATELPNTRQIVPLSQACGKYVDWFRLAGRSG